MKNIGRTCLAIVGCAFYIAGALADPAIILDEPKSLNQPIEHRIQVLDDNTAKLHLKLSDKEATNRLADILLSSFKADGQPAATVGFDAEPPGGSAALAYREHVNVSGAGAEMTLRAPGLAPGIDYVGKLFVTVGQNTNIWTIVLTRASIVPAFECPMDPVLVKQDNTALITLNAIAPPGAQRVDLRLSAFTTKQDQIADVGLVDQKTGEWRPAEVGHPVSGGQLILNLRVEGLEAGSTYLGKLSFATGANSLGECALSLRLPKLSHVELTTDVPSLSRLIEDASPFDKNETARLSLRLFGKTKERRIDGIMASLDGVTESPEGSFDLKHLSFEINGVAVKDLMRPAPVDSTRASVDTRSIPKDGQMNIALIFTGLTTGKYAFALRFHGNGTVEPGPKVDVTLNVRQHWVYAVIAIVLAVLLSMFISRGVVNWRKRIILRGQLVQLNQERFDQCATLPSVLFLRVVIAQTKRLMGKIGIFPVPDSAYDYVARAQRVSAILTRFTALQNAIESLKNSSGLGSAAYFFNQEIQEVMRRLGPQPLDQKTADGILDDLKSIEGHLADPASWYWSVLRNKATVLVEQARQVKADLGDPKVVDDLITSLESFPPIVAPPVEQAYWMLKLLVSRRVYPTDVEQLSRKYKESMNLDATLRLADALMWERLVDAIKNGQAQVALVDGSNALEELSPIKLTLKFADSELAGSYLVNNLLTYDWQFTKTEAKVPIGQPSWTVELSSPRVTQYVTSPCKLEVGVSIRWLSDKGIQSEAPQSLRLIVQRNRDLSFIRNFVSSTSLPDLL